MQTLSGRNIMIVEDDYFVACDLAQHFRVAEAMVLGPFPTVSDARNHVGNVDLAVLDVNLRDQTVYPLADLLMDAAIPFVFYSAQDSSKIPRRFAHIARLSKPHGAAAATQLLQRHSYMSQLTEMLPKLRLSARLIMGDAAAADRLVEATLLLALQEQSDHAQIPPLQEWLQNLMERARSERGLALLN